MMINSEKRKLLHDYYQSITCPHTVSPKAFC